MAETTHILKLAGHDELREIDFELDWLATLSESQRFALMFERSELMRRMLEQHGHREADTIVRRA
jgi:hypothetical protein